MAAYLLISFIALGISWTIYYLVLRKENSFTFNRFYLLGSLVLCLIGPQLKLDSSFTGYKIPYIEFEGSNNNSFKEDDPQKFFVERIVKDPFYSTSLFWKVYGSICFILFGRFILNFWRIYISIKEQDYDTKKELKLISSAAPGNPFSFFNYVFVNKKDLEDSQFLSAILEHEKIHSDRMHTLDVLLVEFLICIFWVNPFVWLYKISILENHEYEADAGAIKTGIDTVAYATQIINAGNKSSRKLISGFSFIKTKNRIDMLQVKKFSKFKKLGRIYLALLAFSAVFAMSSFSRGNSSQPYVVVVDAGHGGHDSGNQNEKEINLQIAQQLSNLNSPEIKIILVRDLDEFVSFDSRKAFIKAQNADLLLSLHCNAHPNKAKRGIEAYHLREGSFKQKSYEISKILLQEQLNESQATAEIKEANFMILRDLPHPSVLLELGYLTNEEDAKRLQTTSYQKQIAKNIYSALLKIKDTE